MKGRREKGKYALDGAGGRENKKSKLRKKKKRKKWKREKGVKKIGMPTTYLNADPLRVAGASVGSQAPRDG